MNGPAGSAGGCKTDETGRRFHPCGSAGAKSKLVRIHAPGNAGSEPLSPPVAAHAPGKRPSAPLSVSLTQSVATIRRAGTPPHRPLPSGRAYGKSPPVPVLQSYVLSVRKNPTISSTNRKKAVQDLSDSFYNNRHTGLLLPVSGHRGGARFGLRRKFRGLLLRRLRQFVPRFFGRGLSQLIPGPGHEFVPLFFGRLHAACHRHAAPRRAASTPDAPPRRSVSRSAPRRPRRSSDAVRRPPLRTERCP